MCLFVCLFLFIETGFSLCIPGCPATRSVDQAGLELGDLLPLIPKYWNQRHASPLPGSALFQYLLSCLARHYMLVESVFGLLLAALWLLNLFSRFGDKLGSCRTSGVSQKDGVLMYPSHRG